MRKAVLKKPVNTRQPVKLIPDVNQLYPGKKVEREVSPAGEELRIKIEGVDNMYRIWRPSQHHWDPYVLLGKGRHQ